MAKWGVVIREKDEEGHRRFDFHVTDEPGSDPFFTHDRLDEKIRELGLEKDKKIGFAILKETRNGWQLQRFFPFLSRYKGNLEERDIADFIEEYVMKRLADENPGAELSFQTLNRELRRHLDERNIGHSPLPIRDYLKKLGEHRRRLK